MKRKSDIISDTLLINNNNNNGLNKMVENQSQQSIAPQPQQQECRSLVLLGHKRYLQCPAGVNVKHLTKFIRMKYGLSFHHRVRGKERYIKNRRDLTQI